LGSSSFTVDDFEPIVPVKKSPANHDYNKGADEDAAAIKIAIATDCVACAGSTNPTNSKACMLMHEWKAMS
jgi:hypothetical protein